ncbi:MAG: hypothetical protein R6V56_03065 [Lentisphaeria bacterium]
MKSAYELAMEKLGEGIEKFTPEQKEKLAEIDRKADAKIANVKLQTEQKIAQANPAEEAKLREDMAVEIQGINQHREREKEQCRKQFRQ